MTWVFLPAQPTLLQSLDLSCHVFLSQSHLSQRRGKPCPTWNLLSPSREAAPNPFGTSPVVGLIHPQQAGHSGSLWEGARPQKQLQSRHYTAEAWFLRTRIAKYKQISNIRIPFPLQSTWAVTEREDQACFLLALVFRHIGVGILFSRPLSSSLNPFAFSITTSSKLRNFLGGFTLSGKMVLFVAGALSHPSCSLNQGSEFLWVVWCGTACRQGLGGLVSLFRGLLS